MRNNFTPTPKRIRLDETPQERGSRKAKREYEKQRKLKQAERYTD